MNRRNFITRGLALPFATRALAMEGPSRAELVGAIAAAPVNGRAAKDAADRPNLERYHLTRDRVLHGKNPAYTADFILEDIQATPGRRFTNFSGDVSGRWIGALAVCGATFGDSFLVLDEVVRRTIALQHEDGYFGKTFHYDRPDDDDLDLLWGNGRLLVGLMEYYAVKSDAVVLASAKKLGDFLLRIAPEFNSEKMAAEFGAAHFASSYICWTQQTEGLAALYAATKDERYRDLCAEISKRTVRRPSDHVHGYLCSVRGTLDLYNATGDKTYLDHAVAAWNEVMNSGDVLITGGVPEAWSPKKERTEGCAECDWLRFSLALYRATGEAKYLEAAENAYFNDFSMNQFATGDFGHARLNDVGTPGIIEVRAWWCCTLHGLRAFPDVERNVFRRAGGEVRYDLPLDGGMSSAAFTATATSRIAKDGTISIRVSKADGGQALVIRKPRWADGVVVTRNGRSVAGVRVDGMKAGDVIEVKYKMGLRTEKAGESVKLAGRSAMHLGPWLLGAPSLANPGYFNELQADNVIVAGSAKAGGGEVASAFAVPMAGRSFAVVPAEYPEQRSRVELRAVAEQTGMQPTRWEMAFSLEPKA